MLVLFTIMRSGRVVERCASSRRVFSKQISSQRDIHLGWDNYKDYTYVGTLDGLYQHTPMATGTRLRPLQATFLGHILGTTPAKNIGV